MLLLPLVLTLGTQILLDIAFQKVGLMFSHIPPTTAGHLIQQHGNSQIPRSTENAILRLRPALDAAPASLYCFMVCHPNEANLLRAHLELGTLHGCDAFDVFSNTTHFTQPLPGGLDMIAAVEGSMDVEKGGPFQTVLNSHIFQQVWRAVFLRGRYRSFDWVVKVDPDTLFFADSVRKRLGGLRPRVQGQQHQQ